MTNKALATCLERKSLLNKIEYFLRDNRKSIEYMETTNLLSMLEVTNDGLLFVPTSNAHKTLRFLQETLDIVFTRQTEDFSSYRWESTYQGITITIDAGEIISQVGTIPTPIL